MTPAKAFGICLTGTVGGCALGALVGYLVGQFAPDYYRAVFGFKPEDNIDYAHLGVGLGITQGLTGGVIVGLGIVAVLTWQGHRRRELEELGLPIRDRAS